MTFNDENLNSVYTEHSEVLNQARLSLDKISADIKRLEYFLKSCPVKNHQSGSLNWSKERLRFSENAKPLIECTAEIRIKYSPEFPEFLNSYMEQVKKLTQTN